jgi:hypothetical protein
VRLVKSGASRRPLRTGAGSGLACGGTPSPQGRLGPSPVPRQERFGDCEPLRRQRRVVRVAVADDRRRDPDAPISGLNESAAAMNFDRPLDLCTGRAGAIERKLNSLLPFCYPILWQRMTRANIRWTASPKSLKKTGCYRTGRYGLKWAPRISSAVHVVRLRERKRSRVWPTQMYCEFTQSD